MKNIDWYLWTWPLVLAIACTLLIVMMMWLFTKPAGIYEVICYQYGEKTTELTVNHSWRWGGIRTIEDNQPVYLPEGCVYIRVGDSNNG